MMTYSGYGVRNNQYAIWGVDAKLPMSGKIITRVEKEVDNLPDLVAAVDMGDHENGSDVDLEEKPQNLVANRQPSEGVGHLLRVAFRKVAAREIVGLSERGKPRRGVH